MAVASQEPRRTPRKAKHVTPGIPKERRCNRCPERPLLRQCAHSAQARKSMAYLLLNQNLQDASPTTPSQRHRDSTDEIPIDPALQQTSEQQRPNTQDSSPVRPQSPPYTQRRPRPTDDPLSLEELASDDEPNSSGIPDRSSPAPSQSNFTFVNLDSRAARFNLSSAASTPSVSRSGSSRIRVSQKNQPYGRVKGAMRGNIEWNIPRRRELEPYDSARENRTKQFQLRMARILQRCEELANVTGCWLYLSGQIATSNHGFVHFASDSLIRDADQRMNDLHAFHSNMHTALSRATVRDVAQVEMENVQVRAQLAEARQSEAAARQSVSEMQEKLEEQGRKLARILQLLPSSGVDVSEV
ncbi:hypothetical protein VNI00_014359 [Paramarasmius palmivorus]|uniref:Uncharacterized protein n=1 Tax=Paramarasmius palmivorus TaxID=297713 RepID=A0AAW0BTN9_9AGAR